MRRKIRRFFYFTAFLNVRQEENGKNNNYLFLLSFFQKV